MNQSRATDLRNEKRWYDAGALSTATGPVRPPKQQVTAPTPTEDPRLAVATEELKRFQDLLEAGKKVIPGPKGFQSVTKLRDAAQANLTALRSAN